MRRRESSTLEFKEAVSKTFLKTVSAYANYEGGEVVFGVADDGTFTGLSDLKAERLRIENAINDSISPMPTYSLSEDKRHATITLRVEAGRNKPFLCKGKAYRRADTATVEVDKIEYGRLVLEGGNITFDELPAQLRDPKFKVLAQHMHERLHVDAADGDVLRTLGLMSADGVLTNAGALIADVNGFPGIDFVRFGSTSREILDRQRLEGVSALTQYSGASDFFFKYYVHERIEGMTRESVERVPEEAFREAVANAIVHRAWDVRANVTVSMYDDRIEVVSPGPLPAGLTETDYLAGHVSVLRNPVLAGLFFRFGFIEQFGTGVLRIKELYKGRPAQPLFQVRPQSIAVVLPVVEMPDLSAGEMSVWNALTPGVRMTRAELDIATGFGKDKTIRMLNDLLAKGMVERSGSGPGVRYSRP